MAQHPGQLVGAGSALAVAVDPGQYLDGPFGLHSLQKSSDGLEIPVAASDVAEVVDLPVHKVKVNLSRTHNRARLRGYVPDSVRRFVRQYFEVVSYIHNY